MLSGKASSSSCHHLTLIWEIKNYQILQKKFIKGGYFELSCYLYILWSVISEGFFCYLSIGEIYDKWYDTILLRVICIQTIETGIESRSEILATVFLELFSGCFIYKGFFLTFRYRKQKPMKNLEMFWPLIWVLALSKPLDIEVLLQKGMPSW